MPVPVDASHLDRAALGALVDVYERTVGAPDLDAFRSGLCEALHASFDTPSILFCSDLGQGLRAVPSRFQTEADFRAADMATFDEHRAFLDGRIPVPPLMVASRGIPERHFKEMATIQVVWPRWGFRESVCARFRGDGAEGLVVITFDDHRSREIERAVAVLGRLRPYLAHAIDHQAYLGRVRATLATTLEDIAALAALAEPIVLFGADRRVEWVSPAARALFESGAAGDAEVPATLVALASAALDGLAERRPGLATALGPHPVEIGGRPQVARLRLLGDGPGARLALTLEDPERWWRDRLAERAARLGLTTREREVAEQVCRGLVNKQIAKALGIRPQTVKNHLKQVFAKLAASTRAGVVGKLLGP